MSTKFKPTFDADDPVFQDRMVEALDTIELIAQGALDSIDRAPAAYAGVSGWWNPV